MIKKTVLFLLISLELQNLYWNHTLNVEGLTNVDHSEDTINLFTHRLTI